MKKVRFLLLSILTMILFTFAVGCEVAGDTCEVDSDCANSKDSCYAGYCGANEPQASVNLEFNVRNLDTNDAMMCDEANISYVNVKVYAHDFEVFNADVPCSELNVHELGDTELGYELKHLWSGKDYDVSVKFNDDVTKTFTVVPAIGGVDAPSQANDANVVKLEKVQEAVFTAMWDIEESDGTFHEDSSSCAELGIDNFRVALDALAPCYIDELTQEMTCDFSEYVNIPCSDVWATGITVYEATGRSIGIYAVHMNSNTGEFEVPFSIEKSVTITQEQLDSGAFERTFHLDDLRGNKK
jgi:hypothetical protein